MDTELQQLVGTRGTKRGPEEVRHAVDRVMHNGKQVGWLARFTGAKLIFLPKVPEALKPDIRNQANEIRRKEGLYAPIHGATVQVPDVPPETLEEIEDDDDE